MESPATQRPKLDYAPVVSETARTPYVVQGLVGFATFVVWGNLTLLLISFGPIGFALAGLAFLWLLLLSIYLSVAKKGWPGFKPGLLAGFGLVLFIIVVWAIALAIEWAIYPHR